MSAQHFYIYYRVADPASAAARDCVRALLADVLAGTGVTGRVMRRTHDVGTWMEIYENVARPEEFEIALATAVAERGFGAHLAPGSRRVTERFESF